MHVLLIFFTGELDLGDSPESKKTRKVQRMFTEILILYTCQRIHDATAV
jgi:hypothetical protein